MAWGDWLSKSQMASRLFRTKADPAEEDAPSHSDDSTVRMTQDTKPELEQITIAKSAEKADDGTIRIPTNAEPDDQATTRITPDAELDDDARTRETPDTELDDEATTRLPPDDELGDEATICLSPDIELDDEATTRLLPDDELGDEATICLSPDIELDDEATTRLLPDDELGDEATICLSPDIELDDEATTRLLPDDELDDEATTRLLPDDELDDEATTRLLPDDELDDDATTRLLPDDELDDEATTRLLPDDELDDDATTRLLPTGEMFGEAATQLIPGGDSDDELTLIASSDDLAAADREPFDSAMLADVTVPGYEILAELGRGAMGVVYKARHRQLQRTVALKMILAGAHSGADDVTRFRAEAESIARLQHPNIVQLYEIGEHEGRPFFSLELVDGGSLDESLKELMPPPQGAAHVMVQLARAMEFAHQQGIVHRDLKPSNILLSSISGQSNSIPAEQMSVSSLSGDHWSRKYIPKVADFGLAKRFDDDSAGQTRTGTIVGTPAYMSPEQAGGKVREVGPAADIYALGAILYVMLTGRPPFKAASMVDLIRQVIDQEPVPPSHLEPGVPLDVETICLKCLQKEPARRYLTAGELADDLQRYLHHEPILARPVSTLERVWKWGKRRPMVVALLGVIMAAVVSMVLFVIWHNVSLQGQLKQARADERQARQSEADLKEQARQREADALEEQRLARVQSEGQELFDSARVALATGDLPNARIDLTKTLTMIRDEPRLAELQEPAQALLKEVEQKQKEADQKFQAEIDERALQEHKRALQTQFENFVALRNEAQFLGSLFTGMDLAANLKASRSAVHAALEVYAVSISENAEPAFDEYLSDIQREEVLGDCYQLFLILAETEAQSAAELDSSEQKDRMQLALNLLDQALRFGSPSKAYHLRRARYLDRLGDEAAATQEKQLAQAAAVVNVLDHFLMADELYRRGELDAAIAEFEHVLQRKPDHFWAQYLNGLCQLRQNRYGEAKTLLTACLAQGRDFVWLYLLRGFAHGELMAFDAADADFDKALQMSLDENSRYVLFMNRGVLRVRQKRLDEAVADLNEAIKLKPTGYQAFVNLALAYRELKDPDAALQQLDRAIGHEPALAHLYRLRARLHVERNEPELALADLAETVRRETSDSPLLVDDHFERGRLLLRAGRHEAAIEAFDAALQRRSDHSLAQRLRAEALFHLGRFQDVIEGFDHYLETGIPLESVYRGRGLAKSELGKYPGAIEDFTKALELLPTSAVQAYRGWMHVVCDAPRLAERDFMLAIELDPENGDAYCGRGFVRALLKNFSEAVADAEEAVRLGPPSPRLLYNAARIHAQSAKPGDTRAFELISEALSLLPADQRVAFWTTQIRSDAAMNAIRNQPEFIQMEKELLSTK